MTVLGSGSWGSALAQHLTKVGHEVTLWGRSAEVLEAIEREHRNPRYFPDLPLSPALRVERDLLKAVADRALVVFAVPSKALPEVAKAASAAIAPGAVLVSTTKGLAADSNKPMTDVLAEQLGNDSRIAVLSGPSFAREVMMGLPTAVTMAAHQIETAKRAAAFFHIDEFRVYTSTDVIGVEYGGVLKNVFALAVGIADGLGMGSNARAALLCRGLAEMQRFTLAMGGEQSSVTGLSGLGDLLLTATGDLSRNRQVGLRLGRGEKLADILGSMTQVSEAIWVAPKIVATAKERGISVPIMEEVNHILNDHSDAKQSLRRLLARAPSAEGI